MSEEEGVTPFEMVLDAIPERGSRRLQTAGDARNVSSGWACFESNGSAQGVATFEIRNGSVLGTIAGVLGSQPVSRFTLPIEVTPLANSGFAIANQTTTGPITVRLTLLDEEGISVAQAMMPRLNPLNVGSQVADFVTSAFPSVVNGFRGRSHR